MSEITKGKSPFYPGQPVPVDSFVGRASEISRILRALDQVSYGKPQAIFLTGEYGIGKSSLAGYMRRYAETSKNILGIHVLLGGAKTLEDVAVRTVEAAIKTEAYEPKITETVRNVLSKYVGTQELFGIKINIDALKADGPDISSGYLPFLDQLFERVEANGVKGIMLILDEINGITGNAQFAHFIKALIDENALRKKPLPLLLMLCGVDERRQELIQKHQPIERIFDVVEINPMDKAEMEDFFTKAFDSVGMKVEPAAMKTLTSYSAGFPKIMHIIGDEVFFIDKDNVVNRSDATEGVIVAAEGVGRKFVNPSVYKALRSKDYHSILKKLGNEDFMFSFKKNTVGANFSASEKKKFNNFLQRMKELKVLKSGDERGEYIFTNAMFRVYFLLESSRS